MGQFMRLATSLGVALAVSFLFYDQRDLSEGAQYGGGGGGSEFRLSEYALEPQRGGGKAPFQTGIGGAQATHPFS